SHVSTRDSRRGAAAACSTNLRLPCGREGPSEASARVVRARLVPRVRKDDGAWEGPPRVRKDDGAWEGPPRVRKDDAQKAERRACTPGSRPPSGRRSKQCPDSLRLPCGREGPS